MNPYSVSGERRLEPTPSAAWQSRSVFVLHSR
jgi:hypothetical protein